MFNINKTTTKSGTTSLQKKGTFIQGTSFKKKISAFLDESLEGELKDASQEKKTQTKTFLKHIADTLSKEK